MQIQILTLAGASLLTLGALAQELPVAPPDVPALDLAFFETRIPSEALGLDEVTGYPRLNWDIDEDGYAEIRAIWNPEANEFTRWIVHDPQSHAAEWQLEIEHVLTPPWRRIWDENGDGLMDWVLLDSQRDGKVEEMVWEAGRLEGLSAKFLDRDQDGHFEVRCWQRFDLNPDAEEDRIWAFDDDGDGTYEREVPGSELTPSGLVPSALTARSMAGDIDATLQWELLEWYRLQGDDENWRNELLSYVQKSHGDHLYRLVQDPMLRRNFHQHPEFANGLIDSLRTRGNRLNEDYVVLWSLGELLRWQSTPPAVHPLYFEEWCEAMGLRPEDLPQEVDVLGMREARRWFLRSLASEMIGQQARESVAFRLARLCAAAGDWDTVDDLCLGMANAALRSEGPMSARHQEYADICFAYGNRPRARLLYEAMYEHWRMNPGDPSRAQPNHTALIRMGIMALEDGVAGEAEFELIRAEDALGPHVTKPDLHLAEQLREMELAPQSVDEYLAAVSRLQRATIAAE